MYIYYYYNIAKEFDNIFEFSNNTSTDYLKFCFKFFHLN